MKDTNNYTLESMTLKDKIAQMIMVRINGEFYNCSIIKEPLYDPKGIKMRS